MKEFMLLFRGGNYNSLALPPENIKERMGRWVAWQEKMEAAGVLGGGHALYNTLRQVSGPDKIVSDRLATEVKELIGGYYLIKAEDYEAAVSIAQDYPDYDIGGYVEIRELCIF